MAAPLCCGQFLANWTCPRTRFSGSDSAGPEICSSFHTSDRGRCSPGSSLLPLWFSFIWFVLGVRGPSRVCHSFSFIPGWLQRFFPTFLTLSTRDRRKYVRRVGSQAASRRGAKTRRSLAPGKGQTLWSRCTSVNQTFCRHFDPLLRYGSAICHNICAVGLIGTFFSSIEDVWSVTGACIPLATRFLAVVFPCLLPVSPRWTMSLPRISCRRRGLLSHVGSTAFQLAWVPIVLSFFFSCCCIASLRWACDALLLCVCAADSTWHDVPWEHGNGARQPDFLREQGLALLTVLRAVYMQ